MEGRSMRKTTSREVVSGGGHPLREKLEGKSRPACSTGRGDEMRGGYQREMCRSDMQNKTLL